MSSPSLQLPVEQAVALYLGAAHLNLFGGLRALHPAHAVETEPDGTYLLIEAEPPDWQEMVINAIIPVKFEFATVVKNPTDRAAAATQHSTDIGKLIEAFSDQTFAANRPALDALDLTLGFTGWEAGKPDPDGTTETQIVTRLPYDFIVYLKS